MNSSKTLKHSFSLCPYSKLKTSWAPTIQKTPFKKLFVSRTTSLSMIMNNCRLSSSTVVGLFLAALGSYSG